MTIIYFNINLVLVIIFLLISAVELQTWTGTFEWNDQCNSKYCCCYAGTLTVSSSGSDLVFASGARGCSSSKSVVTYSNPSSYSFTARGTRGALITYDLSPDANTLAVRNNDYGYCGGSARRTSTGYSVFPSMFSFLVILSGLWVLL